MALEPLSRLYAFENSTKYVKIFSIQIPFNNHRIGFKYSNLGEKVGVKLNDLFLLTEWLKRIISYLSIILLLDFLKF